MLLGVILLCMATAKPPEGRVVNFVFGNESIRVLVPDETLVRRAYEAGHKEKPYWTRVWPSATALCNFISLNEEYVRDREVWECGAGLALPALLASRFAKKVRAGDLYQSAVDLMQHNAMLNNAMNFTAEQMDWNLLPEPITADTVLLSDVNYEPAMFGVVYNMIGRFLKSGCTILLSSPDRLTSPVFLDRLMPFVVRMEKMVVEKPTVVLVLRSDTPDHII